MTRSGSGGALMAAGLHDAGIRHIFTLNGGHLWPLYLGTEQYGLHLVDVRHEQTAAFAAEGWAKLTRSCGVAAVTAGPGVTNAMSGIATARANDSPVLVLGGRAPDARWGQGSLQEIDHLPLVQSITKTAVTIHSAADAYAATRAAVEVALAQRTGPAYVDLPLDVGFSPGEAEEPAGEPLGRRGEPDVEAVKQAARLLRAAERPVLVAGGTTWWARGEEELRRLAEAANLPVVLNGLARGLLPPAHPLFATRARSTALREADVVLVVGAPLDFRFAFGQAPVFADDARLIYVDVDDFQKHRPAAAAIYGDIAATLSALAVELAGSAPRAEWLERLRARELAAREQDRAGMQSDAVPIHPLRLIAEVEAFCDRDAVLIGDGGDFVSFAGRVIQRELPGTWMDVGPFGCLGSGPGYALAARLLHPDRQVVLLSGDGAFGFAGLEVDTFIRHRLPVVTVIGNNGIWALEKHPMQNLLGTSIIADLRPGTRYDRVVEALGGHGEFVERPEQIKPALERAFRAGVAACVNVVLDPNVEYPRSAVLM